MIESTGNRKRLLVLSPSLAGGGAERFTSTLLCHIDRNRFEPHLCLLRDEIAYPFPDDVPVTVLHKYSPWHIPRTIFRLRRHLRSLAPDVVLGTMISMNWIIGAALFRMDGVRRVGRFASSLDWHETLREKVFAKAVGSFLGEMHAWVGNSRQLTRQIEGLFGVPREKLFTINNSVNFNELENLAAASIPESVFEDGLPVIISVGRLSPEKRFDLLLDSFQQIHAQKRARLIICGDGPLMEDLRNRADCSGVADSVLFTGFDSNPFRWASRSDLFVLTSDHEGLPNALIEAQALGLPAVATRCPTGPNEIIEDGITGLLVPVGDIDAITTAILDLLSDEARRRRMGAAARERAREVFDHRKIIAEWEDILEPPGWVVRR
jgi:glycosyltransferase involved in cell wall biosynthesis